MPLKTIAELIERNATNYPEHDAFVIDDRRLNYGEYLRRIRRLASALEGLGVVRQDRVGIFCTNSIEYFETYGACEIAGFIIALYNFRSAPPELDYLVRDSAPRIVLFDHQFSSVIDAIRARLPDVQWVCVGSGGPVPSWAIGFETLLDRGSEAGPKSRSRRDDIAYLFYTSGTTGRPKGVPWTHRGALESARTEAGSMGQDTRVLQISPAFHVGGKIFSLGALWVAGTTVLDRSFDAGRFIDIVKRERITHSFMVPMMMSAVMDHPAFSQQAVSSLRAVMAASTMIPVPLLRRAHSQFGPVFYVSYGSTEGGNVSRLHRNEMRPDGTPDDARRLGSVGHVNPETQVVLLDDAGHAVPQGEIGEICIQSNVFTRYWNNDVATIEVMRDGWLRSGDLGYFDDDNFLFLVDRKKDMIISGGENIYSREVEDALLRHPDVRGVAVFGVPDEKWGESVRALIVRTEGADADEACLIEHCQREIARFKCPRSIGFTADLPLTSLGKVDKAALRRAYVAGAMSSN